MWYVVWYIRPVDALTRLLDLLDSEDPETVGTSIRIPVSLREAATVAAEMGLVASTSELTVHALRERIEAFAQRAVLDEHYRQHPDARPGLAEVALAAAELDENPLARQPDLVRRAATAVPRLRTDPSPDDVLLYAAGLAASVA